MDIEFSMIYKSIQDYVDLQTNMPLQKDTNLNRKLTGKLRVLG